MAFGAWVQGTSKDAGSVTSTTLAFASNVTAGNTLLMTLRQGGTGQTQTVSDNLNGNWTEDDSLQVTGAGFMSIWRFSNTAGGACTVTVSWGSAATMRFTIDEYTGSFTLDTNGGKAIGQGNSANLSSGNLTTSNTCAVYGGLITGGNQNSGSAFTVGSGYTKREDVLKGGTGETLVGSEDMGSTQAAGTVSSSASLPGGSDNWGCFVGAYYNAGPGFIAPTATIIRQAVNRAGTY